MIQSTKWCCDSQWKGPAKVLRKAGHQALVKHARIYVHSHPYWLALEYWSLYQKKTTSNIETDDSESDTGSEPSLPIPIPDRKKIND